MHDYLFTTEVVRFAFMFGVAVSMLLYERRHLTTGSIVVPGYIATFIALPFTLVATFANAFLSYWLINKFLRKWFLLYGRTKFTVLAMISISIQSVMLKFSPSGAWLWESDVKLLVGVGYVVPALIAHDMGRQGIKKTIKSVSLAGIIVAVPIMIALFLNMPGINDLAPLRGGSESAIEVGWIPVAVLLSAASAWGVAKNWGLRSGGFMGAAFVAIMLGDPWQVVVMAVLALITYLLVTRLLMNSMILFGRRKFSAMLLVSASLSWALLWVGGALFGIGVQSHMDIGSLALTPLIVPGLLANDSQRTTPFHVLGGITMATAFVLSATWTVQAAVERRPLDLGWQLTAAAMLLLIFGKPLLLKLRSKLAARWAEMRPLREVVEAIVRPVVGALPDAATWGPYQRWAELHRDAADAADRWLATLFGEPPALAVATAPSAPRAVLPARSRPTGTIERLRTAALRAAHQPTVNIPVDAYAPVRPTARQAAATSAAPTDPAIDTPVALDQVRTAARRQLLVAEAASWQQPQAALGGNVHHDVTRLRSAALASIAADHQPPAAPHGSPSAVHAPGRRAEFDATSLAVAAQAGRRLLPPAAATEPVVAKVSTRAMVEAHSTAGDDEPFSTPDAGGLPVRVRRQASDPSGAHRAHTAPEGADGLPVRQRTRV